MLEDITNIDFKILSLFVRDYSANFSIRNITRTLNINYSNAFKRIKKMIKNDILLETKIGKANNISLNIKNIETMQLISFVEEYESRNIKNTTIRLLIKEIIQIDPFSCIGLFGSRVSGKAKKTSDWDVFVISQKDKKREIEKILAKFPHKENIQLLVLTLEEFQESILSTKETVVKHIIRNKHILYNPHPFYNLIYMLEVIKYAPGS